MKDKLHFFELFLKVFRFFRKFPRIFIGIFLKFSWNGFGFYLAVTDENRRLWEENMRLRALVPMDTDDSMDMDTDKLQQQSLRPVRVLRTPHGGMWLGIVVSKF